MNNLFKSNWEETKQSFLNWWCKTNISRPLIVFEPYIFYMDNSKQLLKDWQGNWESMWTSVRDMLSQLESDFKYNHFTGDEFPFYSPYLGPGSLAIHLGSQVNFGKDTIWFSECFNDLDDLQLEFNKECKWWKWTINALKYAKERSAGRYLVSIPDIQMGLDVLASLIGTQNLLYSLIDSPSRIHQLQRKLIDIWKLVYNKLYHIVKEEDGWSSYTHFYIWGPGKVSTLQCDFSSMISPAMFEEFMIPYLKEYAKELDCNIYHLDGPDSLRHLDLLLDVNEIQCIQWTPGAGNPDGGDPCWDSLYKRTLDKGKCIYALVSSANVLDFVKRFGKKGVYIRTNIENRDEAVELLDAITRL